jgi:hypothetical protein
LSSCLGLTWDVILLPRPRHSWDDRHELPHPTYLLRWDLTFCLGWWTIILWISTSQAAGITVGIFLL